MSWVKRVKAYLNNSEIDIRERLFMLLAYVALTGILMADILGLIIGENVESILFTFGGFVVFAVMVWIGYHFHHIIGVSYIVAFILVVVFMPVNFFTSGAVHGGAVVWNVFDVIYVVMVLSGRARVIFLILDAIVTGVTYYLFVTVPSLTLPHSQETAVMDSILSFILVCVLLTVMLVFQINLYRRENKIALEQKNEIDELNRAQNRFFSSMSHEIRTPINTIIGLNEMILRENASAEINEDAEHIESASKMLLHLINDILDMSKFNSGQMTLTSAAIYTGDMIRDVVEMIWVRAKEKGLRFEVDVSPAIPEEVMGDEMRIKQILINILNNAVKYTQTGSVALTVSSEEIDERQVKLVFAVTDTGMGIRKESIPYLFDAFRRVDEEKNAMIEGTGLGLSIVKQFVDLMGGQITVNSVYTKGSTFTVELPLRPVGDRKLGEINMNRRHNGERPDYQASFEAPLACVLVVDDTPANLLVVEKLLRDTKVLLTCVGSAEEALEKTMEAQYHVIFMDHLMPEMDGIECLHRIRTQTGGLCKDARVVALTANAGGESAAMYAREGFDGYLVKPISGRMLESELLRLLPQNMVTITDAEKDLEEKSSLWRDTHEMKAMVAISTSSMAALPQDLLEQHDIAVMPCLIETEDGLFRDGIDISTVGLIDYLEDEENHTAIRGADTEEYVTFFANRLREARTVIHITASARIAEQSYRSAEEAARSFNDVMIIDSGFAAGPLGLMALRAAQMAETGVPPVQIRDAIEEMRDHMSTGVVVGSVDYMVRRGQLTRTVRNVANSFLLRPVIATKHGKLSLSRVYFGSDHRVWRRFIRHTLKNPDRIDKSLLLVVHVGLELHERDWIRQLIEEVTEFEEIRFLSAPPSIALTCGPGAFALAITRN